MKMPSAYDGSVPVAYHEHADSAVSRIVSIDAGGSLKRNSVRTCGRAVFGHHDVTDVGFGLIVIRLLPGSSGLCILREPWHRREFRSWAG